MAILLEKETIRDIPVLTLAPADAWRCPPVFLVPGFAQPKETGLGLAYRLARVGFFVVSLDPWLHGERHDRRLAEAADPALGGIYPPESGLDTFILFYKVIDRCLSDVRELIAHFEPDSRVDVSRGVVMGPSMGGYASTLIFANLAQVKAAVPMIGIPTFTRRWLDLLDECTYSNPEWAQALRHVEAQKAELTAWVRQIDPAEKLPQAAPRALLMMNGDFDSDQPKHYAIDCYRTLQGPYADHPDNLRLRIYPVGHTVTPQMEDDAVNWFVQHLRTDA
ncbi:MAG TPA: prolyl oligopeptidase family serine peptidase [Aggregatilineales bacterium]|nr:prolyl oligopeptidase family serine peptidase [Aggregatilineales bacterium]